ncbi:glycoside hydrolase family 99-like domain-containing protein, partial [Acidithiobacillus ferrooxidans]
HSDIDGLKELVLKKQKKGILGFFNKISYKSDLLERCVNVLSRIDKKLEYKDFSNAILPVEGKSKKEKSMTFTDEEFQIVYNSKLFDEIYYLNEYPEVKSYQMEPLVHFMERGWKERKNPSRDFDVCFYLIHNKDVYASGMNPLLHYCGVGRLEGRLINSDQLDKFNNDMRLSQYKDQIDFKLKDTNLYKKYEKKTMTNFDVKAIAFYLPQFHPVPENDLHWEKGFTEWTNVTKATQNFLGHYQPQLPIDLGFYDLRIVENILRQAELARNYGIYGFCFHHYWFDGKPIMRTPIDLLLEHKEIKINFCINWANENWTKKWDGRDNEIILKQNHSYEDDILFISDSAKYFSDDRYIKIDGKPLLIIYRPSLFPNIKKTADLWRDWCKKNGFPDLYLCLTDSFEDIDPKAINFDASIEFVPNTLPLNSIEHRLNIVNPEFNGGIVSYDDAVDAIEKRICHEYKKFRGIIPAWDNTPRRQNSSYIVHESTPEKYKHWLKIIAEDTLNTFKESERFIFINAWNEWAEGAHLEPDRKFGYSYLDATHEILSLISNDKIKNISLINKKFRNKNNKFFLIHAYYFDIWDEFELYIKEFEDDFDFFVSISIHASLEQIKRLERYNCFIIFSANSGRDIEPLFKFYNMLLCYDYGCKVSFKKSSTEIIGDVWREQIFDELLSRDVIDTVSSLFKDKSVGMIIPESFMLDFHSNLSSNFSCVSEVCKDLNIAFPSYQTAFSAGTMFWFRPTAMMQLSSYQLKHLYEPIQQDGTILHAFERIFAYLCEVNGYQVRSIERNSHEGHQKPLIENIFDKGLVVTKGINRLKKIKSNLIVFVHYNENNFGVDSYVFHYLKSLEALDADILFVSNSNIDVRFLKDLSEIVDKVIFRENSGFDFSAYKLGLSLCDYWNYEKVFLVNDTIYGPFESFSSNYSALLNIHADLIGLTSSLQFGFHIQSYFIGFDKRVTKSDNFRRFWSEVKEEDIVDNVIMKYEVNLTKFFTDAGYSAIALFKMDENVLMTNPLYLIRKGFPFIKKKIIRNLDAPQKNHIYDFLRSEFPVINIKNVFGVDID